MRSKVFRVLSGLLAIAFIWFLVVADHSGRTARELFGFTAITVAFVLFAAVGTNGAERFLASVFGGDKKA